MSRLRITLASSIACLFVAGAGRPLADVRPGPFGRGGRRGRHQGSRAEVRRTRARPATRRPSRRCSRPTPTSSSRTGRGGKGATSWSAACSSRRGRPAASGPSPSSRSGCSVPTSRWPTGATRRRAWPGAANRAMWTTIVLKRGPDGWRIAAIRNMLPARRRRRHPPRADMSISPTACPRLPSSTFRLVRLIGLHAPRPQPGAMRATGSRAIPTRA